VLYPSAPLLMLIHLDVKKILKHRCTHFLSVKFEVMHAVVDALHRKREKHVILLEHKEIIISPVPLFNLLSRTVPTRQDN
jgi:hypothetical protein